jgi:hypothetical protein
LHEAGALGDLVPTRTCQAWTTGHNAQGSSCDVWGAAMTIDQLIIKLKSISECKTGDAEVFIWSVHSSCYQSIAQLTFGANGDVYIQSEELSDKEIADA